MTIAAAWVRGLTGGVQELVFCSDSRLSGGNRFDHCPKLFQLARTDAGICFAGGTSWAYPMVVAASRAAEVHFPSATRALRLPTFKTHLVTVLNEMQGAVHTYAPGENIPEVTFLLGGYDWIAKEFRIWRIAFKKEEMKFIAHEKEGSGLGRLGKLEMAGDPEWIQDMRRRLKALCQQRYGKDMQTPGTSRFDMEPFEIIRDMLRAATPAHSIGGAPQVMKVYQHMNCRHVGVYWPARKGGVVHVSGRPILAYERIGLWSLDPDTMISEAGKGTEG